MFIFFLLFYTFLNISNAAEFSLCKGVDVTFVVTDDSCCPYNNNSIYTSSFKLNVVFYENNNTNQIMVSSFTESNYNSSFIRVTPYIFYPTYTHDFNCFESSDECNFFVPNGEMAFYFIFGHIRQNDSVSAVIFITNGTISSSRSFLNNENSFCFNEGSGYNDIRSYILICCNDIEYVDIDNLENATCEEFETNTIFNSLYNSFIPSNATFKFYAHSSIISNQFNTYATVIESTSSWYNYYFSGDQGFYSCDGNQTVPNTTCINRLPSNDFQFSLTLDLGPYMGIASGPIIVELIRRSGIYLRNIREPFTHENPCWFQTYLKKYNRENATIQTSFCCIKFKNPLLTTTTEFSTTTANEINYDSSTTSINSPNISISDSIGTLCSNDTTQAWLDIIFVIDISNGMSKLNLKALSGELATILQSFTFGQNNYNTIRAGIIIYGTNVTTIFELKNVTDFESFERVLLNLDSYANFYDYGSNAYGALQQAYNLLQNQPSHRVPIIIFVAATYNANEFQGTQQLSEFIKNNKINIIVVNFSPENEALTAALQNISSHGYFYNSTQEDFYISLSYALVQINCFCPENSIQFRYYNSTSKNYTNFADCFYGVNGDTSPPIAHMLCEPGILVSITNEEKFNFITDNIVPFQLQGKKKFTIGLHKSINLEWKWWGYNETEYLLGEYPAMAGTPNPNDNYGYMWNYQGFNWKLQTGNNVLLPYICQIPACDASSYACDQTPLI